ncbi:MAG: threonine/serine exporter family protein [Bacillus sp. (in: firmicutes)]
MKEQEQYDVMEVCALAGKILLQSGAETNRVEDTMVRIAIAFGVKKCECFVIPTGIIFSAGVNVSQRTKLVRVSERTTDLEKVAKVNRISRAISAGDLTVNEAYSCLKEIAAAKSTFSPATQVLAAALSSACFVIMFRGSWQDFFPALLAGGSGYIGFLYFNCIMSVKFVSEFLASIIIGLVAVLLVSAGVGQEIDKIVIGSVMPLVPGLLLTNAVRDLLAGHLVSSLSKGADAFLTAIAIGGGIAVALTLI